ncbi:hypothetical protein PCASD_07368 [Puccinia coronata f. sp. avenae]|uniref:Uncharacterized protein n=1 Tax=Puccinia coronata f. sp. avenae TaxID=200324 RepID=A0A2N5USR5_9BASI|nr:hypothetical protein PCASD_07368 [Puccinia coronata f. sp. avenae]
MAGTTAKVLISRQVATAKFLLARQVASYLPAEEGSLIDSYLSAKEGYLTGNYLSSEEDIGRQVATAKVLIASYLPMMTLAGKEIPANKDLRRQVAPCQ